MRCIINYSSGRYVKSAIRQEAKLKEIGYDGCYRSYRNELPPGSKPHSEIPYHFKPMAMYQAYQEGYTTVLWMDAPVYPKKDISPIFDTIERDGYLVLLNGWTNGEWTSDRAIEHLGMNRETSFSQPHAMACVLGFDLSRADVMMVFNKWMNSAYGAYPGPWSNEHGGCSQDPRVLGHRHDQSAISAFAYQAGWHFTPPSDGNLITYGYDDGYILYSQPV